MLVEKSPSDVDDAPRINSQKVPVVREVVDGAQRDAVDDRRNGARVPVIDDVRSLEKRRPAAHTKRPTRNDPLGGKRQTAGWECIHIAIDDCTRLAFADVLADQNRGTVIGLLRRAVAFYARHR